MLRDVCWTAFPNLCLLNKLPGPFCNVTAGLVVMGRLCLWHPPQIPGVAFHHSTFPSEQLSGNYLFSMRGKPYKHIPKQEDNWVPHYWLSTFASENAVSSQSVESSCGVQSGIIWMITSTSSWGSQDWHPATDLRGGTRGLHMIHPAQSLLSNSLCTFAIRQSANHYAPPLCPIHTGCESVSAPSLIAFLFSAINKKLLLPALEITGLLPSSSQEGGCHIHRCPTSDRVEARSIFSEGR